MTDKRVLLMKRVTLILLLTWLSSCGFNRLPNDYVSRQLAVGMTEQQVNSIRRPDRIQMQTCGQLLGTPWPCKIFIYDAAGSGGYRERELTIVLGQNQGVWQVTSWS